MKVWFQQLTIVLWVTALSQICEVSAQSYPSPRDFTPLALELSVKNQLGGCTFTKGEHRPTIITPNRTKIYSAVRVANLARRSKAANNAALGRKVRALKALLRRCREMDRTSGQELFSFSFTDSQGRIIQGLHALPAGIHEVDLGKLPEQFNLLLHADNDVESIGILWDETPVASLMERPFLLVPIPFEKRSVNVSVEVPLVAVPVLPEGVLGDHFVISLRFKGQAPPSPTPTPDDNPTPTQSPTPSPTQSPTPHPSGSPSPTPSPTPTSSPTPTTTPTPTPTTTPTPTPSPTPWPSPTPNMCGNSRLDPGEQCDDGNRSDGDGCSRYCSTETTGVRGVVHGEGIFGFDDLIFANVPLSIADAKKLLRNEIRIVVRNADPSQRISPDTVAQVVTHTWRLSDVGVLPEVVQLIFPAGVLGQSIGSANYYAVQWMVVPAAEAPAIPTTNLSLAQEQFRQSGSISAFMRGVDSQDSNYTFSVERRETVATGPWARIERIFGNGSASLQAPGVSWPSPKILGYIFYPMNRTANANYVLADIGFTASAVEGGYSIPFTDLTLSAASSAGTAAPGIYIHNFQFPGRAVQHYKHHTSSTTGSIAIVPGDLGSKHILTRGTYTVEQIAIALNTGAITAAQSAAHASNRFVSHSHPSNSTHSNSNFHTELVGGYRLPLLNSWYTESGLASSCSSIATSYLFTNNNLEELPGFYSYGGGVNAMSMGGTEKLDRYDPLHGLVTNAVQNVSTCIEAVRAFNAAYLVRLQSSMAWDRDGTRATLSEHLAAGYETNFGEWTLLNDSDRYSYNPDLRLQESPSFAAALTRGLPQVAYLSALNSYKPGPNHQHMLRGVRHSTFAILVGSLLSRDLFGAHYETWLKVGAELPGSPGYNSVEQFRRSAQAAPCKMYNTNRSLGMHSVTYPAYLQFTGNLDGTLESRIRLFIDALSTDTCPSTSGYIHSVRPHDPHDSITETTLRSSIRNNLPSEYWIPEGANISIRNYVKLSSWEGALQLHQSYALLKMIQTSPLFSNESSVLNSLFRKHALAASRVCQQNGTYLRFGEQCARPNSGVYPPWLIPHEIFNNTTQQWERFPEFLAYSLAAAGSVGASSHTSDSGRDYSQRAVLAYIAEDARDLLSSRGVFEERWDSSYQRLHLAETEANHHFHGDP